MYLTRDGGVKWTDVTPKDMAKFTRVSSIDASKFGECIAYVAANRFQLDDDRPYLWKTTDCGASWTRIDNGIDATEFTRVVREDPAKRGLLVAGTERGVWFSPDDGAHWQSLRLNLPYRAGARSHVQAGRLIVATHGRSFYIMDDITTLEQMTDAVDASAAHLFKPRDQYRLATGGGFGGGGGVAVARRRRSRRRTRRSSDGSESAAAASSCSTGSRSANETVAPRFPRRDRQGHSQLLEQSRFGRATRAAAGEDGFFAPPPPPRVAEQAKA